MGDEMQKFKCGRCGYLFKIDCNNATGLFSQCHIRVNTASIYNSTANVH